MSYHRMIAKERDGIIIYRPEIARMLDSVTAALLLTQICYWWSKEWKGHKPNTQFYKFRSPCNHGGYTTGTSWVEELAFGISTFDNALKKIATKVKPKDSKTELLAVVDAELNEQGIMTNADKLVFYWTGQDHRTYYELNVALFNSLYAAAYSYQEETAIATDTTNGVATDEETFENGNPRIRFPDLGKTDSGNISRIRNPHLGKPDSPNQENRFSGIRFPDSDRTEINTEINTETTINKSLPVLKKQETDQEPEQLSDFSNNRNLDELSQSEDDNPDNPFNSTLVVTEIPEKENKILPPPPPVVTSAPSSTGAAALTLPGMGAPVLAEIRNSQSKNSRSAGRGNKEVAPKVERPPDHPAVAIYKAAFHQTPNEVQLEEMTTKVTDFECWKAVCRGWKLRKWGPNNIPGMLEVYEHEGNFEWNRRAAAGNGYGNGNRSVGGVGAGAPGASSRKPRLSEINYGEYAAASGLVRTKSSQ